MEFQQRWEYRKTENDLDSSCDDSKSSNDPLQMKHKLVSVGDDEETSESNRLKQKANDINAGTEEGQINNVGKAKKRRKTKNNVITNDLRKRKTRRKKDNNSPQEAVDLHKGEKSGPVDEIKSFMETLLEELRVSRENLVKEMMEELRKIEAYEYENGPKRRRRKEKVELLQQQTKKSEKVHEDQHPNSLLVQQENNFQGNNLRNHGMRIQNCSNNNSSIRHPKSSNADYFDSLKKKQPVQQVKGQKTVVLAIEAPKSKGRSITVKGKKTTGDDQATKTAVTSFDQYKSSNGEKLGYSSNNTLPSFLSGSSCHETPSSSMYLTLPTVISEPIVPNHGLINNDASLLCNYINPQRVADGKKRDHVMNPIMLEPNCNIQGSFPVIQPAEERIRSFALMGSSRNIGGNISSGIGSGIFPVMDVGCSSNIIPKQVTTGSEYRGSTTSFPFAGESYNNVSEHLAAAANNPHIHSPYKSGGGRLMSYQVQNVKDGHFFPQWNNPSL